MLIDVILAYPMIQERDSSLPASEGVRISLPVDEAREAAAFGLYSSFSRLNGGEYSPSPLQAINKDNECFIML